MIQVSLAVTNHNDDLVISFRLASLGRNVDNQNNLQNVELDHCHCSSATMIYGTGRTSLSCTHLLLETGELKVVQVDVRSVELMQVVVRCVGVTAAVEQAHTSAYHTHHDCDAVYLLCYQVLD